MNHRSDTGTRIMIATILLIIVLAWANAGWCIWQMEPLP